MDYIDFRAEDFAADESFQDFILHQQPEAIQFWSQWIEEHPEKVSEINAAKELLHKLSLEIQPTETQQALKRLKAAIKKQEKNAKMMVLKRRQYWAAAIAVAILALVYILPKLSTPASEWIVIQTDYGQLREVYLPDSSMVTMNSNSKLKYLANWNRKKPRAVWIEGEAFFDVRKNPKVGGKNFHVHVDEAIVRVLGTSFNVYDRKEDIVVALASGSVDLSIEQENHRMKPNDVIVLKQGKISQFLQEANLELYTSWRNRRLILDNTSISRVIDMLEDNMGLEVVIDKPEVLERRLTATLPINEVDILLAALKEIYGLDIRKEGNTIWIK